MSGFKYKAFISYSHANTDWSKWLLKALESYRLPKHVRGMADRPNRLGRIFRDRDELPATGHMTDRIMEAVRDSEYMIVVCSPEATKSKLVNREIAEFKRCRGDSYLLCLIVDGIPFADDPAQECFPEALKLKFAANGKAAGFAPEGLAADARPDGDGKQVSVMKLVAGMMGVGLNELARRESQRRQRRWMGAAVAAATGMAVLGGLTFEAFRARGELEKALVLVEERSAQAEKNLREVEDLIIFLNTVIYDKLLEAGSLSVLEQVSNNTITRLNTNGFEDLSPTMVSLVISSHHRLGQALERRGETRQAKHIFDTALSWSRNHYQRFPNAAGTLARLEISLFFTGYLARRQGDYETALAAFTERLKLCRLGLERAMSAAPEDMATIENWKEEYADSENGICALYNVPLGQPETALQLCQNSVDARRALAKQQPNNHNAAISLTSSLQYLGRTYKVMGRYAEARAAFQDRKALFSDILDKEPENYRVLRRFAMTEGELAALDELEGNTDTALARLDTARAAFDRLTEKDPVNIMWRADSAETYLQYAETLRKAGRLDDAADMLETAVTQITSALEVDNSRTERRLVAYQARLTAARLAQARNDFKTMRELTSGLLATLDAEGTAYLQVPGALDFAGTLYLAHHDASAALGDTEGAVATLHRLTALHDTAIATKSPSFTESVASAYRLLGETAKAQNLMTSVPAEARQP